MTRAYVLAQALSHAGYDVEIIGIKLSQRALYPLPPANIKVTEVTGRYRWYGLLRLATKVDGDILYAIKPRISSYGIALLTKMFRRTPVILDIDDWELAEIDEPKIPRPKTDPMQWRGPNRLVNRTKRRIRSIVWECRQWPKPGAPRYLRWMDKMIGQADAITVNTRFLQKRYGGTYVPQCKDSSKFHPDICAPEDSRKRFGLLDCIVLMFPGTARPHKGLEDVLVAMDVLQIPNLRLVIVGGRDSGNRYLAHLKDRWAHLIVRLPQFPQEQMPDILAAAHIIVVPQRDTTIARAQFPMKLTDAMAMAKPIISTTVGDIPEILGETGYIIEPSNPEQLSQMLTEILNDLQTAGARGRQGRDRLIEHYSLDSVGRVLTGVVEALKQE